MIIEELINSNSLQHVSTTGRRLLAGTAVPDTGSGALHGVLAAERASVGSVLGDFDLLDDLTKRSTVAGTVLTNNPNLFCALALKQWSNMG